jgi:hypothetical protein
VIDKGLLAEVPSPASTYTGRYLQAKLGTTAARRSA